MREAVKTLLFGHKIEDKGTAPDFGNDRSPDFAMLILIKLTSAGGMGAAIIDAEKLQEAIDEFISEDPDGYKIVESQLYEY